MMLYSGQKDLHQQVGKEMNAMMKNEVVIS